ncbi:MAG: aminotransferase class IV [Parvibaculum sp.]|uniref:aminotransferase class IV n=1 Tax=Parvibaculum sp. TaxID=2024848 RepID=UPI0028417FE2|nr:aminotransferase class IV [Parvibaculum sp.]MDR3500278.1 aminotransferase class IV [Parvibaculum sp.]
MIIWLNGALVNADEARIDPRDRGFLLGDGLFETLLARQGRIAFLDSHVVRLAAGGNILGIPMPASTRHLAIACGMLLEANGLMNAARVALRITLTRGPGPRGLLPPDDPVPTLMITAAPSPPPPAAQSAILATPRRNALSPVSRLKALPYLDNLLAREEARARGADEALLLDTSGHLACASVANVFLWEKDRLVTPAEECGILPGVTRAAILELSERLGIDAVEDMIAPQRLQSADGAFLTNSLIGIMPLSRIDRRELPAHRLTGRLQAAYDLLLDADEEEGLDTLPED